MRLDFDDDGSVSVEDLKKSMVSLYDFLANFDLLETTTSIKTKLYTDAIAYMQNELDEDRKQRELQQKPAEASSLAEPLQPSESEKKTN